MKATCIPCINAVGAYLGARSKEETDRALAALRQSYEDLTVADGTLVEKATELYSVGNDDICIDEGALTSEGEYAGGVFVQAWVWVPHAS